MSPEEYKKFLDFYRDAFKKYGDSAQSLHWIDEKSQNIRFEIFNKIADLNGKNILDVGCGLGDFYKFFIAKNIQVDYTGIDIVPDFINRAKEKFPGTKFRVENILSTVGTYDYVFASGALNFTVSDSKNYYFSIIKKMFDCSKYGLAFNMLNKNVQETNEIYYSFDIDEVKAYCETLTKNIMIISDYVPWDFTVYMYK
jgi:trans-aconitate methyltransferase